MKEYLKMSDVFKEELYTDDESGSLIIDDHGIVLESFSGDKVADYTLHAINSHDELVAEVERLRDALQDAYLDGCHYGWEMSAEGYNAEYGGPNDGKLHNQFIESYSGESYTSE